MERLTVIQEFTAQGEALNIRSLLMARKNLAREECFALFIKWADEFIEKGLDKSESYYDEVDEFMNKKYEQTALNTTSEYCPHCDSFVELAPDLSVQKCPNCGKWIVACSMCLAAEEEGGEYCKKCALCYRADVLNKIDNVL